MNKAQRKVMLSWVKAFDQCLKDGREVVLLGCRKPEPEVIYFGSYYPVQRVLF